MGPLIAGVAALVLIMFLIRSIAYADPKLLARILRYTGAAGLGIITVFLAVTGRIAPAFFFGSMAWGLATGGHVWPAGWPHYSHGSWRSRPASGGSSSVRAEWVEMTLDHDSGEMRGTVLKGPYKDMELDRLTREEAVALYCEARGADPESARLLEAWLDRKFGSEWQDDIHQRSAGASADGMSREEALKILGLQTGATTDEIRAAHRRLILQNHPDRGGSDYLAARINEARDVLLGN